MVSDFAKEQFQELIKQFHKENVHLQSLKNDDKITVILKDKFIKMDNGEYTPPSFNGYNVNGNFIGFKTHTNKNGRDVFKRVSFEGFKNSRTMSFSKKQMSADGISMADFIICSPFLEGGPNCKKGAGIFEIYDVESRQSVANNEVIENAKLTIALSEMRKDEAKLNQVANILGCDTKHGIETKIGHILSYARKNNEQRTYVNDLLANDDKKYVKALSIYNIAKSRNVLYPEGAKTMANIANDKIFIVQSTKEETIVKRLLADDETLLITIEKELQRLDKK